MINNISILFLGAIQGLTEFLPISSSGHLFFAERLLHLELPLVFEILLHIATLFAICVFSRALLFRMLGATYRYICVYVFRLKGSLYPNNTSSLLLEEDKRYLLLIVAITLSTLVTAPIAFLIKDLVIHATSTVTAVSMLSTALFMAVPFAIPRVRQQITATIARVHADNNNLTQIDSDHAPPSTSTVVPSFTWRVTWKQAVLIGLIQGMAVLPGVSRSGTTISIGVLVGLGYVQATQFSFLLAIPAILGSFVFSIPEISSLMDTVPLMTLLASMTVAFFCGLFGLRWLSIVARKGKIWYFSCYLLVIGMVTLILL